MDFLVGLGLAFQHQHAFEKTQNLPVFCGRLKCFLCQVQFPATLVLDLLQVFRYLRGLVSRGCGACLLQESLCDVTAIDASEANGVEV